MGMELPIIFTLRVAASRLVWEMEFMISSIEDEVRSLNSPIPFTRSRVETLNSETLLSIFAFLFVKKSPKTVWEVKKEGKRKNVEIRTYRNLREDFLLWFTSESFLSLKKIFNVGILNCPCLSLNLSIEGWGKIKRTCSSQLSDTDLLISSQSDLEPSENWFV